MRVYVEAEDFTMAVRVALARNASRKASLFFLLVSSFGITSIGFLHSLLVAPYNHRQSRVFWNSTFSKVAAGQPHRTTSQLVLVRVINLRGAVEKWYNLAAAQSNRAIQPDISQAYNDKYFLDFRNVGLKGGNLILFSPDNATASYVRNRLQHKLVHTTPESGDRVIEVTSHSICQTFSEETALVDLHQKQWFNAWHFHNDILFPLIGNLASRNNCDSSTLQCHPPAVLYHRDDVDLSPSDMKTQLVKLIFSEIRPMRDFSPAEDVKCVRHLTWGTGPPVFLEQTSRAPDALAYSAGLVQIYRRRVLSALHLTAPSSEARGLTLLFFSRRKGTSRGVSEASVANVRRACEDHRISFSLFSSGHFSNGKTLRETLQVFASASIAAGSHGAGLVNALYFAPGGVLIDFINPDNLQWMPKFTRMGMGAGRAVIFASSKDEGRRGIAIDEATVKPCMQTHPFRPRSDFR